MPASKATRDLYESVGYVTLNGHLAYISGWSNNHGTVWRPDSQQAAGYSWTTIDRILKAGGKFEIDKTPLEQLSDLDSECISKLSYLINASDAQRTKAGYNNAEEVVRACRKLLTDRRNKIAEILG